MLFKVSIFRRYFLYALGEIVIVVIGILFALSINNWNEQRKEDQAEQKGLENLKQDFVYNLDIISVNLFSSGCPKFLYP